MNKRELSEQIKSYNAQIAAIKAKGGHARGLVIARNRLVRLLERATGGPDAKQARSY